MRTIIFTRGLPGAGKSTYLHNNGLLPYTICADDIRLLYSAPIQTISGSSSINQKKDSAVWEFLLSRVGERMVNGDLTVVDATHCRNGDFGKYRKLVDSYRYRAFCIDFSDTPLETCLANNLLRPEYKIVPEEVIFRMNKNLAESPIPSWITTIKPGENIWEKINQPTLDFNNYKKIVHFGDIQGCYTPLAKYFETNPFDKENLYIFVGDFIDRGKQNAEVIEFMLTIYNLPNVLMLEGNHEAYLTSWANDEIVTSREFANNTQKQLEEARISKKDVRQFTRKLRQMIDYSYHGKRVVITHGGIAKIPTNFVELKTRQLIHGVGAYDEHSTVDHQFYTNYKGQEVYQIHGHRNSLCDLTQVNPNCYNLEGKVEFGGELRVVELTAEGFNINNIPNQSVEFKINSEISFPHNEVFLHNLKENSLINEKILPNNISSFNFSTKVFYDKKWDDQNIKARGLFLNNKTFEIVARSYNKFFNIDEMATTKIDYLAKTMVFPVKCYHKYNGYLGILGYDNSTDSLVFASKSTTTSEFAGWFQDIFDKVVSSEKQIDLKNLIRDKNLTLVFEVIDVINDPHIVKYDKNSIRLLDAIHRNQEFSKLTDRETTAIANVFGFEFKKCEMVLNNAEELINLYDNSKTIEEIYADDFIEGYVLEDTRGFLTKLKLPLYSFWKHIRTQKEAVAKGRAVKFQEVYKDAKGYEQVLSELPKLTPEQLNFSIIDLKDLLKSKFG
jgi:predicted kinase